MAINPNVYAQYMNQMPRGAKSGALNALTRNYGQMRQRQFQADAMNEEARMRALKEDAYNRQIAEENRVGAERNSLKSFTNDMMSTYGQEQPNTMGPMPSGGMPLDNRASAIQQAGLSGVGSSGMGVVDSLYPELETVNPFEGYSQPKPMEGPEGLGMYHTKPGAPPILAGGIPPKKPIVDMSGMNIGGKTGAELGTIPPGYQAIPLPGGGFRMEQVPGGPVEAKEQVVDAKARGRREQARKAGRTVIQDLQRGLNLVEKQERSNLNLGSGPAAIVSQHVPWMDAGAAKAFKESALSNVGLDTLQNMRDNSPTGGALGQVPIQQQKRLEQVLGSLDLTQRTPIVKDNIKRIINLYKDSIYGTPEEISALVETGELQAEKVGQYMFRHKLSFDEFGNPVDEKQTPKTADDYIKKHF